jgi:AcrR family transcriptional regulator
MSAANAETSPPPRRKRVYRRAADRRAEIISAAQEVFARATFGGARTREIAELAGVNQATLFKHFETKEKLFEEAVMKPLVAAMDDMHARIELYGTAATPEEMAALALPSTRRHLADMDRLLPLLTTALFSDVEQGRRLFRDFLEPMIIARGEVLRDLAKPGIDPQFVGLASFGMMFAVAMQRWLGENPREIDEAARQLNRLATTGFARTRAVTQAGGDEDWNTAN